MFYLFDDGKQPLVEIPEEFKEEMIKATVSYFKKVASIKAKYPIVRNVMFSHSYQDGIGFEINRNEDSGEKFIRSVLSKCSDDSLHKILQVLL